MTEAGAWYFFVYAVCIFLSRPFMGRLLDNRGENYVMYPLLLSFAAGMALLSQAESALVLLLSAAFVGLGYVRLCRRRRRLPSKSPRLPYRRRDGYVYVLI